MDFVAPATNVLWFTTPSPDHLDGGRAIVFSTDGRGRPSLQALLTGRIRRERRLRRSAKQDNAASDTTAHGQNVFRQKASKHASPLPRLSVTGRYTGWWPSTAPTMFATPRTGEDARPYKRSALTVTFSVSPQVKWQVFDLPRKMLNGLRRRRMSCGSRLHRPTTSTVGGRSFSPRTGEDDVPQRSTKPHPIPRHTTKMCLDRKCLNTHHRCRGFRRRGIRDVGRAPPPTTPLKYPALCAIIGSANTNV